jgi:hypothetical protein
MKNPCNILWKRFSITIGILLLGLVIMFSGCSGGYFSGYIFSISGQVSGAIENGVNIELTNDAEGLTVTGTTGGYTFNNLSNGSYIITPSLSGYTFTPAHQEVTISRANVININFTAAVSTEP